MNASILDLFYAFRQAKIALFFERRGVGHHSLAQYEENLNLNLIRLNEKLSYGGGLFKSVKMGKIWIVPKKIQNNSQNESNVINIGTGRPKNHKCKLDVQIRFTPHPEFAIAEVLFIWKYGVLFEALLSPSVIGYRLEMTKNRISKTKRYIFEYWPKRYEEFRRRPIETASRFINQGNNEVSIISADFASFYDNIDSSFIYAPSFISELLQSARKVGIEFNQDEYIEDARSLDNAYRKFRTLASKSTGLLWDSGIPIGALTSRLVANCSLIPIDRIIEQSSDMLLYRRYVDDIVIVSSSLDHDRLDEKIVLSRFLPTIDREAESIMLDSAVIERIGCNFEFKQEKIKIHNLKGKQGLEFLNTVSEDFLSLVSESRAFIDTDLLDGANTNNFSSSKKAIGSKLVVLRDADRIKLENLSLANRISSLERISRLIDIDEVRQLANATQSRIFEVLESGNEFLNVTELVFRLLRLALATDDLSSFDSLSRRIAHEWCTINGLQGTVAVLRHKNRIIERDTAWEMLRKYLEERFVESISMAINQDQAKNWNSYFSIDLGKKTVNVIKSKITRRAKLLAQADLRGFDREEDPWRIANDLNSLDPSANKWSQSDDLFQTRLKIIQEFIDRNRNHNDFVWPSDPYRLFLSTRPPSYFDVAQRYLVNIEYEKENESVFDKILKTVNALRGTEYNRPVAKYSASGQLSMPVFDNSIDTFNRLTQDPTIVLGNLCVKDSWWEASATKIYGSEFGKSILTWERLKGIGKIIQKTNLYIAENLCNNEVTKPLLILPELSVPRQWLRFIANYIAKEGIFSIIMGLEYLHDHSLPLVTNQVYAVIPGEYAMVAAFPWTKLNPAREEETQLHAMPISLSYNKANKYNGNSRIVINTEYGNLSVLVCSEIIETNRISDLLGRAEVVLVPSWNKDTSSYDHIIKTVGLQLCSIIAVINNGEYSDCRVWAPLNERYLRDMCRLISRGKDDIIIVQLPVASLRSHRERKPLQNTTNSDWRPLAPDWPR